ICGLVGIFLLSVGGAFLTWWVTGPPDRRVACDSGSLEAGEICLADVLKWEKESILWVDARTRALWKKNGAEGSILLTDDNAEDYDELEGNFVEAAFREGDPYHRIVIYCGDKGCGSSKAIAAAIREKFAEMMGFEVYVLYGGWKALAAE
ncbi:rhodanese-like domain-containing protein, partial [Akkermansiaceae bacterium]|nr:rhodanese-like domain-containing protein [Akkermansiaceae bacterium]